MREKKICVLHAQIPFAQGGAELLVKNLATKLKGEGYSVEMISLPFKWYPENSLYDSMLMWKLLDLSEINGEKIDLVIPTKFPTYGLEHHNKIPWLVHQHRAAYDLFDNVAHFGFGTIENGERMRENIVQFDKECLGKMEQNIYTISNNVTKRLKKYNNLNSTPLYPPAPLEGKYYSENYENYILSVGRLDPIKRLDLLIKALKTSDKKIKLKIAGMGPDRQRLEKLVETLNLKDRVIFCGFVSEDELLSLYANAGAVYFAPVDEDYGYVTLESYLSKKPILTCYDSGEVLEFVKDGESGVVCGNNPEEISSGLNSLFSNLQRAKEYGNQGFANVQGITWRKVIDALTHTIR